MSKKQTFKLARRSGPCEEVVYHPIIFVRGTRAWRLALHREPSAAGKGGWVVSDPISGYRACRVTATYKGLPVSTAHLTTSQARAAALIDLDLTVDRVGLERFTAALDAAQNPQPAAQA